jgi:TPR repeat protein
VGLFGCSPSDVVQTSLVPKQQSATRVVSLSSVGPGLDAPERREPIAVRKRKPLVLEQDCTLKDYAACAELGERYTRGVELDLEPEKAAELRSLACTNGIMSACRGLGGQYLSGSGVPVDEQRGLSLLRAACDGEDADGCEDLTHHDLRARGALFARAFELHRAACDRGDDYACFDADRLARHGHVDTALPQASWDALRRRSEKDCASGREAMRCWALWRMAQAGLGASKDEALAVRHAERGCGLGEGLLCGVASRAYLEGQGVAKDPARGLALEQQGCDLGWSYSCYFLGANEADPGRKREYMRRGCEAGDTAQCSLLASELDASEPSMALPYRERACRRGSTWSCAIRGNQLLAASRPADAMPWFERACRDRAQILGCVPLANHLEAGCANGNPLDCSALDTFLATLTTDRRVAVTFECCPNRPELARTPGGALLLFLAEVERGDIEAVRTFVHPKHSIRMRIGWHDEDGSSEESSEFNAKDTSLGDLSSFTHVKPSSLTCGEVNADGSAGCGAHEGGAAFGFGLLRENDRFYVTDLSVEEH